MRTRNLILSAAILALAAATAAPAAEESALKEARMEGQLWATYALNRHLNPFDIEIDVEGDTAVLKGAVEEDIQRELAEQIALSMDGIDSVDNRIEIQSGSAAGPEDRERGFGDRVTDASITTSVKSKLLWNRHTGGLAINVDTRDGQVTLEGAAESDASRQVAERLAANTRGVRSVDNRIRVEPGAADDNERSVGDTVSDSWITTKVKSTLLFSRGVSGTGISVETTDGVVKLSGTVASEAERELARHLARDIRGVNEVDDSELTVVREG